MLISHKYKFITIDIPKTGTRSLRETLTELCNIDIIGSSQSKNFNQHGTATDCHRGLKDIGFDFHDYFSFCIIRNPWERYLSFFKYHKQKAEEYINKNDSEIWDEKKIIQGKNCLNLFKQRSDQEILRTIIVYNRKQSDYYLNNNNEIMVSHIGEFGRIQEELDYLCDKVVLKKQIIKHANKSTIECENVYNQELIDLVAKKEEHVINMNGYNI